MLKSEKQASEIRALVLKMAHAAQASHVGSALSTVDLLTVYYGDRSDVLKKNSPVGEDILIFSKGHAAMAQYASLAYFGLIDASLLETYGKDDTLLSGHVSHSVSRHIPLSTGSLGHGLPFAIGIAIAKLKLNHAGRVYVLVSDGEMDEGTTWESALLANQLNLSNLTVIIDRNRIQSLSFTENVLVLEPLADKWKAFNWNVVSIDGHAHTEIKGALDLNLGPTCVIAETIKGRGVSFMENTVLWHYRPPNDDELKMALSELGQVSQ